MRMHLTLLFAAALLVASPLFAQQGSTSQDDERLARVLKRFPEADANKDGVLTRDEARKHWQARRGEREDRQERRRRGPGMDPTHKDLAYGEHERQRIDLYLAPSETPTPLVVFIHGGGFVSGGKEQVARGLITSMHDAGISVAAINYRFVTTDAMPACFHDGAKAVQYLRHHAKEYNLDPARFAATGGSAGAGISLWLAFHDDLADPDSDDPISRESSRLTAASVNNAQVSYDPRDWRAMGLERALSHRSFAQMYGNEENEDENTPRIQALMEECAPITHFDSTDPPVYFLYSHPNVITDETPMNALIHHPVQALTLKKKMDDAGVTCLVSYPDGERPEQRYTDFLVAQLKPDAPAAE